MAQIALLDKKTIDQIAAGEVVERPSSVVKELVENAIDAGAFAISIEIKEGGRSYIRITDDGCGINPEELPLAFTAHATSKLTKIGDLDTIASLGFRGEALASIASVSRVEMTTKRPADVTGTRYCVEGGKETVREEVGAPDGTTIIIRDLFFNVPARLRFLKTALTEASYVGTYVEQLVLSHPGISFKYIVNGSVKISTSGNGSLKDVLYRLYGKDLLNELVPVEAEDKMLGASLSGFIAKPVFCRGNRQMESYYVNGRYVKNKVITKAIEDGFGTMLMQHKYPFSCLFLDIDGERVDVNVHPAKLEVKFANEPDLYTFIRNVVAKALADVNMIIHAKAPEAPAATTTALAREAAPAREASPAKTVVHAESAKGNGKATVSPVVATAHQQATVAAPIVGSVPTTTSTPAPTENAASSTDAATTDTPSSAPAQKKSSIWNYIPKASEVNGWKPGRIKDNRPAYGSGPSSASGASSTAAAVPVDTTAQTAEPSMTDNADVAAVKSTDSATAPMVASQTVASTAGTALSAGSTPTSGTPEEPVYEQQAFAFLSEEARKSHRLIGQVFDTYWLIEYDGALYIIDQHAAHEKVLFERLMREYSTRKMASQVISPPEIINMTIAEEAVIQTYGEAFAALGFVIEPFGGRDFALREVPYTLESLGSRRLFEELLEALSHAVGRPGLQDLEVFTHRVATEACKAAVKGNDRLSFEEADALIRELLTLEDPYHCPHGRPTIITMTRADLEKRFKRIV